jgi:uncharacterized protein (TIGR02453 family)
MELFSEMFAFLELLERNNSKTWMDANRDKYHRIRDAYIDWLDELNERLVRIDPDYTYTEGRRAIHRINNNLMFHPDKPVYKEHIGATLDRVKMKSDFYIHIGLKNSFIAGGYYHPSSKIVQAIREALDYDGEVFREIIEEKEFRKVFGEPYNEDALKTFPKGYDADHPHIDLLRLKSYAVEKEVSRDQIISPDFMDEVVEYYKLLMPFRNYLNRAVFHAEEMAD